MGPEAYEDPVNPVEEDPAAVGARRSGRPTPTEPDGELTVGSLRRIDGGHTPDLLAGTRVRAPASTVRDSPPEERRRAVRPREHRPAGPVGGALPVFGGAVGVESAGRDDRPGTDVPQRSRRARRGAHDAVEANARLTGSTASVIFVLLAVEGVTLLRISPLLNVHVFVGMLLVPPVLLKTGTTTWRFARYYLGDPAYRRKGPPQLLLRLLGPVVIVMTVAVLVTGIVLLVGPAGWRGQLILLHKASFVVWLVVMTVHVLGHLVDTARLAPRDWCRRTRRQVRGAGLRQWLLASSIALGSVLGTLVLPSVGSWLSAGGHP